MGWQATKIESLNVDSHAMESAVRATASNGCVVGLDLDVAFPYLRARAQRDDQITGSWGLGLPEQAHASNVVQPVALAMIALVTGAGGIGPGIPAALGARDNMIDGEVSLAQDFAFDQAADFVTAIDAGVIVTYQYAFAAPVRFAARDIDKRLQRDYRRDLKLGANGIEILPGLLHSYGFAGQQQVDRTLHRDDGQRFPGTAIKQQHAVLQYA